MKKFVIWGPKLHQDTFSYVHFGFYRSIESLGHQVSWYSDGDDVSSVDFSDSIFIGEHQHIQDMPVLNECTYFIHNIDCGPNVFKNVNRPDHPRYYNYLHFFDNVGECIWPDRSELTELEQNTFYHEKSKTVVIMWATDLLPEEIDQCEPALHEETIDSIYFVGTIQGNNILEFQKICNNHGKTILNVGGYTGQNSLYTKAPPDINANINCIRNSYISFDIREEGHLKFGRYYPCRLFKNISYGKWTGSNNPLLADVFGEHFTCDDNLERLYDRLVESSRKCTKEKLRNAMNFVRDHHTYVSRVKNFLQILE